MNFLEAFEELDELNEASNQYQIPDELKYRRTNGKCPGCGETYKPAKAYEQHITGFYQQSESGDYEWVEGCEAALKALDKTSMPARIKVGKKDHSYDEMTNITAADLLRYKAEHKACEICGAKEKKDTELVYDHAHARDGSHTGAFRGVLCNQCNTLLGLLDRNICGQNPMSHGEYLRNIIKYLSKAETRKLPPKADTPDMDYKYNKLSK